MAVISDHAKIRIKERCGLPKKAIRKNAELALQHGVKHGDCTGRLKKYVDYLYLSHKTATNIRLYGAFVYIFAQEELVTVLPLHRSYKDAVNKIKKRNEENNKLEDNNDF